MNKISISSKAWVAILSALVTSLGLMATDIYAPAMPAVTRALLTSPNIVQLTVTLFLIAAGLSQLIYGPLSDQWGRRRCYSQGWVSMFWDRLYALLHLT